MTETPIGRRGVLYTYTVIHQLPQGYDEPFAVGYVDLDDGVRVFAHIENTPKPSDRRRTGADRGRLRMDETAPRSAGRDTATAGGE